MNSILRESTLVFKDRSVLAWTFLTLILACFAVFTGLAEVSNQRQSIERLTELDATDRRSAQESQNDWGSHAYYSFHLTYAPPSDFAFAAIGQRDVAPWKHRVRALALEGQIYESDVSNPDLSLIGRFDYAFFIAFVVPIVLIALLHGMRSNERSAGRYELLVATGANEYKLWMTRTGLRAGLVLFASLLPLIIGSVIAGTASTLILLAGLIVILYVLFWSAVCYWVGSIRQVSAVLLAILLGVWLGVSVIIPALTRMGIETSVTMPSRAELIVSQREAVNDSWDLPFEATMIPFAERHPEWKDHLELNSMFEWKWYFAFQQVGDQKVEPLTTAYRNARLKRDQLANQLAWFSPPSLIQRTFERLAQTDQKQAIAYEDSVRTFHKDLRTYYYPKLFLDQPYVMPSAADQPSYQP